MRAPRLLVSLSISLIWLFVPLVASADSERRVELTILHTNDTHGHLLPYSYPETFDANSDLAKLEARANIGGAARRATLINQIRREKSRRTLLIDAGDV